jgi:hypothetical protein
MQRSSFIEEHAIAILIGVVIGLLLGVVAPMLMAKCDQHPRCIEGADIPTGGCIKVIYSGVAKLGERGSCLHGAFGPTCVD